MISLDVWMTYENIDECIIFHDALTGGPVFLIQLFNLIEIYPKTRKLIQQSLTTRMFERVPLREDEIERGRMYSLVVPQNVSTLNITKPLPRVHLTNCQICMTLPDTHADALHERLRQRNIAQIVAKSRFDMAHCCVVSKWDFSRRFWLLVYSSVHGTDDWDVFSADDDRYNIILDFFHGTGQKKRSISFYDKMFDQFVRAIRYYYPFVDTNGQYEDVLPRLAITIIQKIMVIPCCADINTCSGAVSGREVFNILRELVQSRLKAAKPIIEEILRSSQRIQDEMTCNCFNKTRCVKNKIVMNKAEGLYMDINWKYMGKSMLMHCSDIFWFGKVSVTQMLIQYRAEVCTHDSWYNTAIMSAAANKDVDMLRLILENTTEHADHKDKEWCKYLQTKRRGTVIHMGLPVKLLHGIPVCRIVFQKINNVPIVKAFPFVSLVQLPPVRAKYAVMRAPLPGFGLNFVKSNLLDEPVPIRHTYDSALSNALSRLTTRRSIQKADEMLTIMMKHGLHVPRDLRVLLLKPNMLRYLRSFVARRPEFADYLKRNVLHE